MPPGLQFIAAQLEPGSHLRRDLTDALPCLVLLHPLKMEQSNGEVVASIYVEARS